MKQTLEFTPVTSFPLTACAATAGVWATQRVLAFDATTGDQTLVLYHPPGQEWGGEEGHTTPAHHAYWEVR